ncbi:putative DNA binding domain-containing protein [Polaromonas sp. P1-6]|nr:putative DNA binding domain-containing protein [Polaromonas sp. P1-6]
MIDLSPAQAADRITALLAAHESRKLDFKRISAKHGRMIETLCAFANTDGGLVVIGVGDAKDLKPGAKPEGRLFGVEENPEAFDLFRRQVMQRFDPPLARLHWLRVPCTLHNGQPGHVVLLRVEKSEQVHSVVGNGTWTRMDASNRELSAAEIADLAYQRGVRSAASETVPIPLALLETDTWRSFVAARGLRAGSFAEQLQRIGLAASDSAREGVTEVCPTRAAVLLFAEEPGSLLAAHGTRADIRLMVYEGKAVVPGSTPNLRKKPKTVRGPLINQISEAVQQVLDALTEGITLAGSGFKAKHVYPERVVKEAIVNAVIHRDYRLNRDIFIRIFDDRIEVESPGTFPGSITPDNIGRASSKARNPLIAQNLREFSLAPNFDAGEGVKMMFAEMAAAKLYPPQYRQSTETAVETVTVTLLNLERPSAWDEVSDWIDREGFIQNAKLCEISKVDTLRASKMLVAWREQGLLVPLPDRAKRNMAYTKPAKTGVEQGSLLSGLEDNNGEKSD